MKTGIQLSLAVILGLSIIVGLRACDPFAYLEKEDKFILKGTVER